jgi:transporter family-2 protein
VNNLYMLLSSLAGAGLATQAAVNTQLRAATGSALSAALLSTIVTILILGSAQLLDRNGMTLPNPAQHPWWLWIGGVLGAYYMFSNAAYTRHLGVALMFGSLVVGQLLAGLLIDHYGLFRAEVQPLTPTRLLGAAMLIGGLALIRWR